MISAILFDFGGTLDSDGLHWLDRFFRIYERLGLANLPQSSIKEAFYWADRQAEAEPSMRTSGLRAMMERHALWQMEKLGLKGPDLQNQLAEAFYKPVERILRRNRHVLEKLSILGCKLGVISNFYGNVQTLCEECGFMPFLDVVLDSMTVGLSKPDPAIFRMALDRLKVSAEETAFVGDSVERDMIPAKSVGMRTYWLAGDHRRQTKAVAEIDATIYSLEDLPSLISAERKVGKRS